jgi:hypothetical protein
MAFGCRITERGHFTSVSEAGARTLCSTADLYRYSDQHQMLNMHILCRCAGVCACVRACMCVRAFFLWESCGAGDNAPPPPC